jgi:hypothetical protein
MKAFDQLSKHVLSISFVAATVAFPAIARAEDEGPKGTVTSLEANTTSADLYLQQHGRVVILTGKSSAEYRWGGTSCGSRTLSDAMVAMLQRSLESGTPVIPRWQDGQGSAKCIVGITLAP